MSGTTPVTFFQSDGWIGLSGNGLWLFTDARSDDSIVAQSWALMLGAGELHELVAAFTARDDLAYALVGIGDVTRVVVRGPVRAELATTGAPGVFLGTPTDWAGHVVTDPILAVTLAPTGVTAPRPADLAIPQPISAHLMLAESTRQAPQAESIPPAESTSWAEPSPSVDPTTAADPVPSDPTPLADAVPAEAPAPSPEMPSAESLLSAEPLVFGESLPTVESSWLVQPMESARSDAEPWTPPASAELEVDPISDAVALTPESGPLGADQVRETDASRPEPVTVYEPAPVVDVYPSEPRVAAPATGDDGEPSVVPLPSAGLIADVSWAGELANAPTSHVPLGPVPTLFNVTDELLLEDFEAGPVDRPVRGGDTLPEADQPPPPAVAPPAAPMPVAPVDVAAPHSPAPKEADVRHDPPAVGPNNLDATIWRPIAQTAMIATGPPTVSAVRCVDGHLNPLVANSCRVCARPVPPQDAVVVPRPTLGILRMSTSDTIRLDHGVIFGRDPGLPDGNRRDQPYLVMLPDKDISRRHLEVVLDGWDVVAIDLNSSNGSAITVPGGVPEVIPGGSRRLLVPGSTVYLSDTVSFVYEVTP